MAIHPRSFVCVLVGQNDCILNLLASHLAVPTILECVLPIFVRYHHDFTFRQSNLCARILAICTIILKLCVASFLSAHSFLFAFELHGLHHPHAYDFLVVHFRLGIYMEGTHEYHCHHEHSFLHKFTVFFVKG